jgi:hypothetical protein
VDQKSRSEVLQHNEQIKAASRLNGNIGTALLAAGSGRWFFDRFDENVIFWLLLGAGLIWVSVSVLTMLETES